MTSRPVTSKTDRTVVILVAVAGDGATFGHLIARIAVGALRCPVLVHSWGITVVIVVAAVLFCFAVLAPASCLRRHPSFSNSDSNRANGLVDVVKVGDKNRFRFLIFVSIGFESRFETARSSASQASPPLLPG